MAKVQSPIVTHCDWWTGSQCSDVEVDVVTKNLISVTFLSFLIALLSHYLTLGGLVV